MNPLFRIPVLLVCLAVGATLGCGRPANNTQSTQPGMETNGTITPPAAATNLPQTGTVTPPTTTPANPGPGTTQ